MDYRSLYHTVLANWFDISDNQFKSYKNDAVDSLIKTV